MRDVSGEDSGASRANVEGRRARHVALFPGAFQPPHAAHFEAVRELVAAPGVDEVVVIIANRPRAIPGTAKVLDAQTSYRIWSIYLEKVPAVRLETARHTAVEHALEYFDRLVPGDRLTLCIGEADLADGDDRFADIDRRAFAAGVSARIAAARTAALTVRASDLRADLVRGEAGRSSFCAALPPELSPEQRKRVWEICVEGLRDEEEVVAAKVLEILAHDGLPDVERLVPIESSALRTYRAHAANGTSYTVKHAGDSPNRVPPGRPRSLKPRKRLETEVAAIAWLNAQRIAGIRVPRVELFDRTTWTLALSGDAAAAPSLENELATDRYSERHAEQAALFLAHLLRTQSRVPPLRADVAADRRHWTRMLETHAAIASEEVLPAARAAIRKHVRSSHSATRGVFVHLGFVPACIRLDDRVAWIVEFGASSSVGDPAFDVGSLLGRYWVYGLRREAGSQACGHAMATAVTAYQKAVGPAWGEIADRIVPFVGISMLVSLADSDRIDSPAWRDRVRRRASSLLTRDPGGSTLPGDVLEGRLQCAAGSPRG